MISTWQLLLLFFMWFFNVLGLKLFGLCVDNDYSGQWLIAVLKFLPCVLAHPPLQEYQVVGNFSSLNCLNFFVFIIHKQMQTDLNLRGDPRSPGHAFNRRKHNRWVEAHNLCAPLGVWGCTRTLIPGVAENIRLVDIMKSDLSQHER